MTWLDLIYQTCLGMAIRPLLTRIFMSRFVGWLADRHISRHLIKPFIKSHKIDMNEFIVPATGYKTFNDFFYRRLQPGTRSVNQDEDIVTSPADSHVFAIQELTVDATFFVKGCKFNIHQFFNDETLAKTYENGSLLLFRLSPQDYHRFHFPFDCIPGAIAQIHGKLESVNPVVYKSGIQPLTQNERHLIMLNSPKFGIVPFAPVGAMFVGKIIETYQPEAVYKKGDEAGYFAFGGSSIVMLFKSGIIKVVDEILQNSKKGLETEVKMGLAVATRF